MYTINQIADYVILKLLLEDDNHLLSNLKLQKLLYFIQAWSYGKDQKPIFNGKFEAWIHGPVNTEIFRRFRDNKSMYSLMTIGDVIDSKIFDTVSREDAEFIDYILENYAGFSGSELEQLSHLSEPWIEARGNLPLYERCTTTISEESLKDYYGKSWAELNQ